MARNDKNSNVGKDANYRMSSRDDKINRQKQAKDFADRRANGQTRGDLNTPDIYGPRYNYDTYKRDYYSGSQASVFFGDVWVDDIVTINYNIQQNKTPIYGYASQYYDAIALGTVIGQGQLVVAFKEVGYLNVIQALLEEQKAGVRNAISNVTNRIHTAQEENISQRIQTTADLAARLSPNLNPSLVRKKQSVETILDNLKGANVNAHITTGLDRFTGGDGSPRDFEDIAEVMEDTIWGDSNGSPYGSLKEQMRRADEFDYIRKNGEPIGIKSAHGQNYTDSLNILITFGDMEDQRAEHTLYALNDVHFTAQSVVVQPDGEPIGEVYSFIFRDINKSINTQNYQINPIKFNIGLADDEKFVVSRLQDISKMEEFIDNQDNIDMSFLLKSGWDGVKWNAITNTKEFYGMEYGLPTFRPNQILGIQGSMNQYVEDAINEYYLDPKTNLPIYQRLALRVKVEKYGRDSQEYNFVIENEAAIQDTTTLIAVYKVIAPSKNDYFSLDLVKREDFFKNNKPLPTQKEIEEALDIKTPNKINSDNTNKTTNKTSGYSGEFGEPESVPYDKPIKIVLPEEPNPFIVSGEEFDLPKGLSPETFDQIGGFTKITPLGDPIDAGEPPLLVLSADPNDYKTTFGVDRPEQEQFISPAQQINITQPVTIGDPQFPLININTINQTNAIIGPTPGTQLYGPTPPDDVATGYITATEQQHLSRVNPSNPASDVVLKTSTGERVAVSPFGGQFGGYNEESKTVWIDNDDGTRTVIAHQRPVPGIKQGDYVYPGKIVGYNVSDTGTTAQFTGLHSHIYLEDDGGNPIIGGGIKINQQYEYLYGDKYNDSLYTTEEQRQENAQSYARHYYIQKQTDRTGIQDVFDL